MAVKKNPSIEKIQWTPRVSRNKIRQLYENDAKGIVDEEMVDEVAYALYARCKSILTATEASKGKVKCPCCGHIILRQSHEKGELLSCDECSWEVTWGQYFNTYTHQFKLYRWDIDYLLTSTVALA